MLNPKKKKAMVVIRSRVSAPGYGDLTLSGAELEEVKSFGIHGVIYDSKLTFQTHLRESHLREEINNLIMTISTRGHNTPSRKKTLAARNLGVVRLAGKLFECSRVLKGCFNAYVLSRLEYCAPV